MPRPPTPSRRAVAPAVVVAALLLGAAACGDDGGGGASESTTSTSAATTASTATTTATTAGATPPATPSDPTAFTATARDAANELKAAWEAGDQARARAIAPGEVVDALFPIPPDGFEVYGCDTGEFDTSTCSYRNRSTGLYITVSSTRSPEGWQVSTMYVDGG